MRGNKCELILIDDFFHKMVNNLRSLVFFIKKIQRITPFVLPIKCNKSRDVFYNKSSTLREGFSRGAVLRRRRTAQKMMTHKKRVKKV